MNPLRATPTWTFGAAASPDPVKAGLVQNIWYDQFTPENYILQIPGDVRAHFAPFIAAPNLLGKTLKDNSKFIHREAIYKSSGSGQVKYENTIVPLSELANVTALRYVFRLITVPARVPQGPDNVRITGFVRLRNSPLGDYFYATGYGDDELSGTATKSYTVFLEKTTVTTSTSHNVAKVSMTISSILSNNLVAAQSWRCDVYILAFTE